jgi:site-specific DNA recombinase
MTLRTGKGNGGFYRYYACSTTARMGKEGCKGLKRFAIAARRKLKNEDGTYHRDHLQALVRRVEVVSTSEIRLIGQKTELLRTLASASRVASAATVVRSFVPKWRTRQDSNL